jgi:hypothetical protein
MVARERLRSARRRRESRARDFRVARKRREGRSRVAGAAGEVVRPDAIGGSDARENRFSIRPF